MRITILTGPFNPLPPAPSGAVEKRWVDVAKAFVEKGHEVTFLCKRYGEQNSKEEKNGISFVRKKGMRRTGSIYFDIIKDFVYSLKMVPALPKADILVVNAFWMPLLALLKPGAGKVLVNVARVPKGQLFLYFGAARLVVPTAPVARVAARQAPFLSKRIRIIPNPVDTKVFSPPEKPRNWDGGKVILYAGRIHPEKGVHLLIKAFAEVYERLDSCELRIVGPAKTEMGGGGERYLKTLEQAAEGLPVRFIPPIADKKKLAEEYRSAHIFCYPSLAEKGETFGVAPLEAMGTGLVPVVSGLDCFRDFITEGEAGLFFDHKKENAEKHLAEVLYSLLSDSARAMRMGEKAARRATDFATDRVAEMYLEEFRAILSEGEK